MAPMDMRPKIDPNRPLDLRIATEVLGQKPPWDFDHSGELEWTKEEFPDPQNPALVRIRRWPPYYSRDPLQALLLVEQLQALFGLDGPPSGPVQMSVQEGTWYAAFLKGGRDAAWSTGDDPLIALCKAAIECKGIPKP